MVWLSDYDFVGFDLDHTLIQYRLDNLYQLVYESFIQFLVKEKGYDTCLLDIDFKDLKDFCLKGLVLDTRKGNFLKLRNDGFIIRASHGTRQLTRKNIIEQYGDTSTWPEFSSLKDNPVQQSSVFRVFENYFDLPVAAVCACIVDVIDQKAGRPEKYYSFWPDIVSTLVFIFNPSSFADQKGNFFPSITKDTAKFVKPCSKHVVDWIKSLRSGKRKVFLLTNSYIDYTNLLLNYAVGSDWAEMFDVVICMAGKPGFFKQGNSNQFREIDGENDIGVVEELQEKKTYSHGNIKDFTRFVKKCTEKEDPAVLYFGDSLKSDLYPCVQFGKWNVVAVIEEMESEGMVMNLRAIDDKNSAEDGPTPKRARHVDIEIEKEKEGVLLSNQWGSLFIDDSTEKNTSPVSKVVDVGQESKGTENGRAACSQSETKRRPMDSFWGDILQRYSSVAIPRIDFIAGLPLDYTFDRFSTFSGGFFPGSPRSLHS